MRRVMALAVFVGMVTLAGFAQETPKPEVFGGYQYTRLDGWNGNGFNGSATMYINRWLGVQGDFSGAYATGDSFLTYTGGPVVSTHKGMLSPFGHALFGGAHAASGGVGDSGFAMMFGGGLDVGNKKLAFRVVQMDWMITRFNGFSDKNNVRLSTGALFRF
jgi:hypothetical protein